MNCFMGYNPLVAKEVKITTWIKEFDGDSPVYPSFPNDGDCFVVFATDEDALTHNALSKKTYTNGDWADAEGGGGGGDFTTCTVAMTNNSDEVFTVSIPNLYDGTMYSMVGSADMDGSDFEIVLYKGEAQLIERGGELSVSVTGNIEVVGGNTVYIKGDGTITFS